MTDLSTTNIIAIIGWGVTFVLGVIATLTTQRFLKEKKKLTWAITNENDFSPSQHLRPGATAPPIKILVGGVEADAVHSVQVQIANSGNKEVEGVTAVLRFGDKAQILNLSLQGELGAWKQFVTLVHDKNEGLLEFKHINPKQKIIIDAMVMNYTAGGATVDASAPGVFVSQSTAIDVSRFGNALIGNVLRTASFSMLGVRLDPQVTQTALLVEEVRNLRLALLKGIAENETKRSRQV